MEEVRSGTGGVKPFPIEGRMADERERLVNPMTDVERKMRAQWVKDQILAPHEPVYVPEIEKELLNPIRRFYRAPLDKLFKALEPSMLEEEEELILDLVKKRKSASDTFKTRESEGVFQILINNPLIDDEIRFKQYLD